MVRSEKPVTRRYWAPFKPHHRRLRREGSGGLGGIRAQPKKVRREPGRIGGVELSWRTKSSRRIDSHVQARRGELSGGPAGIRIPGDPPGFTGCL